MEQNEQRYPIGIQTFSEVIENRCVYIDKTRYIWRMTHTGAKYYFLSRPRRFGKSLLTSTLHCYFAGRKELFKGLAIARLEKDWTAFPVLHFDLSKGKHLQQAALERYLLAQLKRYEDKYDVPAEGNDTNIRLENLIVSVSEKTGQKVVVLVDEYDAPLLDVVHLTDEIEALRFTMRNFYSPLKALDPYLRFVFLTGITKFSQMSIFSELNNLNNISMDEEYASICGITEEEITTQLRPGIERLADRNGWTAEHTVEELKRMYDGYHFTWPSPDVYNPYSLLNALDKKKTGYYWFESGTPSYIIEMLRKHHVAPSMLGSMTLFARDFNVSPESRSGLVPLLYQSGYLTITGYIPPMLYNLGIPNEEVRQSLMENLLYYYIPDDTLTQHKYLLQNVGLCIANDDMDGALKVLQSFLSTIPYTDNASSEGHFQQLLYVIFSFLGCFVDVEVHTPRGRVDMVVKTSRRLYLLELKMDKRAADAVEQINLKNYAARFAFSGLPVVKVGVNFDSATRTISDWVISKA